MTGILISQITGTDSDKVCDIEIVRGGKTISSVVTYMNSLTSVITGVSPPFGSSAGSETLTLTGSNFGSSVSVEIDGVSCSITSQTAT